MKLRSILAMFILVLPLITFAQDGKRREKMEQVKSMKIAYITNELSLTPDESAKFWPIYNSFEEKQKELRRKKAGAYLDRMDANALDNLSDKDATAALAQIESNEDEVYQHRKKFMASLRTVLPARKIIRLKKAEEDFNRKLLKQYREKGRSK